VRELNWARRGERERESMTAFAEAASAVILCRKIK
jgi:hypothetical protein